MLKYAILIATTAMAPKQLHKKIFNQVVVCRIFERTALQ